MKPAAAAAPSPPVDAIGSLNDFSDRISPIVVKELRQGLRQPSFVILFLFLQSVLAIAVVSALVAVSSGELTSRVTMGNVISGFFFGLFALAVIAVQPLRGLGTLSSETRDSTIDLLLLTRLSAWRIVFGKWLCLVTQSALLLVAMVPYLMMRYFLGGMNLLAELTGLLLLFLLGAMMCAAGVGMSAVRSVILRVIFAILGVVGFITFTQGIGMYYAFSRISGSPGASWMTSFTTGDWIAFGCGLVLLISFLTHAFLEFGATRIAPPAENRSTFKRLVALVALLGIPAVFLIPDSGDYFLCYLSILLITPVALADALSESPRHVRPMGRRLPWFLQPGWPSGTVFGLIVLGISGVWLLTLWNVMKSPLSGSGYSFSNDTVRWMLAVGTILLMAVQPALVVALVRTREGEPANLYLSSALGSLALGLVMMMIGAVVNSVEELCQFLFPVFPILGFGLMDDAEEMNVVALFMAAAIYLVAAAAVGRQRWGHQPLVVRSNPPPES